MRLSKIEGVFSRGLLLVLYACFFFVQFNTRTISAKEFRWHSVSSVTAGTKEKVVKAAHGHTQTAKLLSKRFVLQQVFLIAALIVLKNIYFSVIRKEYGISTVARCTAIHYPWSLRGPPETVLTFSRF